MTKTVCVGEDVTLTCSRQKIPLYTGYLFWTKLAAGNFPEVLGATYNYDLDIVNKTPRITTKQEPGTFVLHITKAELNDTAFYYCEQVVELQTTFLNKTFLRVKGKWRNIHLVHTQHSISNFSFEQCSVLSCVKYYKILYLCNS